MCQSTGLKAPGARPRRLEHKRSCLVLRDQEIQETWYSAAKPLDDNDSICPTLRLAFRLKLALPGFIAGMHIIIYIYIHIIIFI